MGMWWMKVGLIVNAVPEGEQDQDDGSLMLSCGRTCCVCERMTSSLTSPFSFRTITPLLFECLVFYFSLVCLTSPLAEGTRRSCYWVLISFFSNDACLIYFKPAFKREGKSRSMRALFTSSLFFYSANLLLYNTNPLPSTSKTNTHHTHLEFVSRQQFVLPSMLF